MSGLLDKLFPVRAGERRLTLVMLLHNLFAVGAFIAGRSVRDALFLSHAKVNALAWMYVLSAFAVAITGVAYSPLAARVRRDRMAGASAVLFGGMYAAGFLAAQRGAAWLYPALYVYVEVMGSIALVQFWTLLNELFHAREARRLYAVVGTGGMLANVLVGLATRELARTSGAPSVLLLCAGLCFGVAAVSFASGRVGKERLVARAARAERRSTPLGGAGRVARSTHLRAVALLAGITFVTTTCVDFEFKVTAAASLQEAQLTAYFGGFYATVGVLALGLQLFGTGPLLNRLGLVGALLMLPVALGAGNLAFIVSGTLFAAAIAKGADSLFRYTVNDATTQLLYLPVPPHTRATAKAFIDGVVKSVAIGLAGLLLLTYRSAFLASMGSLAKVTFCLCVAWAAVVVAVRSGYVESLQETLRQRRLGTDGSGYPIQGSAAAAVLTRALYSGEPREVLSALELLPRLPDVALEEKVSPLLEHPLPEVRLGALGYFRARPAIPYANAIFRCFEDPSPAVRAAAIETFCDLGKDKAIKSVHPLLTDPEPLVRSAAIAGMIRVGGLDGVMAAAEALKELITHPDAAMRLHAARVLGTIGVKNFYQPVLELMNDPDPAVRLSAIAAAGALQSPELVLPLIYKTRSRETGARAVDALAAYGAAVAPMLKKVLANPLEDLAVRRSVARVLGRLGSPEVVGILLPHLTEPDDELRTRVYRALARTARAHRLGSQDKHRVEVGLEWELTRAFRVLAAQGALEAGLGPVPPGLRELGRLLTSALAEKAGQAEERLFLLLGVLYPDAGMEHIYEGIRGANEGFARRRRANAVELLDNLLGRSLKRPLLPFLEDLPLSEKLSRARGLLELPSLSGPEVLGELLRDDSPWVRACALHLAASLGHPSAHAGVVSGLADPDAVVRETALKAAGRARPAEALELARTRLEDESGLVRRLAEAMVRAAPSAA